MTRVKKSAQPNTEAPSTPPPYDEEEVREAQNARKETKGEKRSGK